MARKDAPTTPLPAHGILVLPAVTVDSYNLELQEGDAFVGDRASNGAFVAIVDDLRERLKPYDQDPFGDAETEEIGKSKLSKLLTGDNIEAAGLIHAAIEKFAGELAFVARRFLRLKEWKDTERIVIGGGFRQSRLGELTISRVNLMLKSEGIATDLIPISHHADEAGLIGAAHLSPTWILAGHECMLAADIGGSNIRVGVVSLGLKKSQNMAKAKVWKSLLWRHADEQPTRDEAVAKLADMLREMIDEALNAKLGLAPFIGIGCPGLISQDGSIERGGQNLPGNWENSRFNLPHALREAIPTIEGSETAFLVHNDAVVQGLSAVPETRDVARWGVFTVGTGLGNARFTNRELPSG